MNERDRHFYKMCKDISQQANCLSRKIGTVLVKDDAIISVGWNGPPEGLPLCNKRHQYDENFWDRIKILFLTEFKESIRDIPYLNEHTWHRIRQYILNRCPRRILGFKSGEGLEYCVAVHAERRAILNAARNGKSTKDAILYMSCGTPCGPCLVEIIEAGIKEIVVTKVDYVYDKASEYIIKNSNLKCRLFDCEMD